MIGNLIGIGCGIATAAIIALVIRRVRNRRHTYELRDGWLVETIGRNEIIISCTECGFDMIGENQAGSQQGQQLLDQLLADLRDEHQHQHQEGQS